MARFRASALVFDLDGTLVHSGPDLADATNRMLESLDLERQEDEVIFDWLGNGATRLVQRALTAKVDGKPDPELFDLGYARFLEFYRDRLCVRTAPYPHVVRVLEELKSSGYRLACLTNKPGTFTLPILEALNLDHFFEQVVTGDSLSVKKPDPMPLYHIFDHMGVPVSSGVMVGDSISDIHAAQAAGMPVICVSYGYNQGLDLTKANPDAIIDSFADLPELIEQI